MRIKLLAVAMAIAAALGAANFADALGASLDGAAQANRPATRIDPPAPPAASTELQTFELVNAERTSRGLAPLQWNDRVATAAQAHSDDMAATRTMSHTGSDGSDGGDRLRRVGYRWTTWGENVAAGYATAASVTDGWMNSPGHRDNMLAGYEHGAIATARSGDGTVYWTLLLGSD